MSGLQLEVTNTHTKEQEPDFHDEHMKISSARSIFSTLIGRDLFPEETEKFIAERFQLINGDMTIADKAINQYGPRMKKILMERKMKRKES